MRYLLLAAVLLAACPGTKQEELPKAPDTTQVSQLADRKLQIRSVMYMLGPGDTLKYKAVWSKGQRATGYVYYVKANVSGWTLPTNVSVADTAIQFNLINMSNWDAATFTLVVKSTNSRGTSKDSSMVTWSISRGPGAPGVPGIDSSGVILSLFIKPDSVKLVPGQTQQFCAYVVKYDLKYYMTDQQNTIQVCKDFYDQFPLANRLPGYPVASVPPNSPWRGVEVKLAADDGYMKPVVTVAVR